MENKIKSFAIYCSQGASRILKFYSDEVNLIKYPPKIVIYDGDRIDIIMQLKSLFLDKLIIFDCETLALGERNRIHTATSVFIHKQLKVNQVDFLLCFGDKILKKDLINDYQNKLVNFHPSILPSFKGLQAIDQALKYNASLLGNTAHYIDEGIDTGKIIIQTAMLKEDFEIYEDVLELQFPMIKIILRDLLGYVITNNEAFKEVENRKKGYIIPLRCNIN